MAEADDQHRGEARDRLFDAQPRVILDGVDDEPAQEDDTRQPMAAVIGLGTIVGQTTTSSGAEQRER